MPKCRTRRRAAERLLQPDAGRPARSRTVRAIPVIVCAIAFLALVRGGYGQEPGDPPTDGRPVVASLEIEGNRSFSDEAIEQAIATRESGCKAAVLIRPFCWLGLGFAERTERLDPRELRTDIARIRVFYYRRGYRQASVDTSITHLDSRVHVTYHVDEGEPVIVRDLEVAGLEGILDPRSVISSISLAEREPFSEIAVRESQRWIEDELRNRGYARAEVLVNAWLPRDTPHVASLTLEAIPGRRIRIGSIEVVGAEEVDPEAVKRLLSFRPGDIYREREFARSQRNLYSLALFEYADVAPDLSGTDTLIPVRVQVNEADIHSVRMGFGLSTTECFEIEGGWTHRNIFGGIRRLELSGAISNILTEQLAQTFPCDDAGDENDPGSPFNDLDWRLRSEFQQPWFISSRNSLRLALFAERQSIPPIFARKTYGTDVTLARELGNRTPLTLSYRTERDNLEAGSASTLFCGGFGICRPEDVERLQQPNWLSNVTVSISRERTDIVFDPSRGYRTSIQVEHGSGLVGSDYRYNRVQGEISAYRSIGPSTVLAARLRGGIVRPIGSGIDVEGARDTRTDDVTHPLKRFYAGGAATVRGYAQNLLGPKVLKTSAESFAAAVGCDLDRISGETNEWVCQPEQTLIPSGIVDPRPVGGENILVGSVEMRFRFDNRWQGAAFVDVGQVWTADEGVGGLDDLAWTPGVGVRYLSPVGPLRLDIGYNTGGFERRQVVAELEPEGEIVKVVDAAGDPLLFGFDPFDETGFSAFLSRLQLNFSIGQAF